MVADATGASALFFLRCRANIRTKQHSGSPSSPSSPSSPGNWRPWAETGASDSVIIATEGEGRALAAEVKEAEEVSEARALALA